MSEHKLASRVKRWVRLDPGINPIRSRLGRRLLAWLLLFSLVPLLGSNMIGYLGSQAIIERLASRSLRALAGVEALHVGRQIDRTAFDLREISAEGLTPLAHDVAVPGLDTKAATPGFRLPDVEEFLRRESTEFPEFDLLYLQTASGKVIAASQRPRVNEHPPPRLADGGLSITLLPDLSGGAPSLRLTVPVAGKTAASTLFLSGVLRPDGLSALLGIPSRLAESVETFIVDEGGRVILASDPHGGFDYSAGLSSPLLSMVPGAFARYRDREDREVLGTCIEVPGVSWRYVMEFPVEEAMGPLRLLRGVSLGFASIFALMLLAAAWFVAGGIVAPIRRLAVATHRVGGGQLSVRVDAREKDEIGELGRAFNKMTERLARTSAQVEELHRREIERAQQLATVGELASGVAHEIKNPVVSISNGLDLVTRRIGHDEKLSPILEEMSREISRIEVALRDLLAFARPTPPRRGRAKANLIAERATHLVQPAAESAKVALDFCPSPALPELVVDEELIRQALVNLMMNAVQATPPGGHVRVCTRAGDGEVEFEVSDTGRGIAPEDQASIFRPFFTTRHSGSGLGLSISREIVEKHGGRIRVRSRVGEGSTFTVILPVNSPGEALVENKPANGVDDG